MQTVLITITTGTQQSIDLEAPGSIPISELLPGLLALCDLQPSGVVSTNSAVWGVGAADAAQPFSHTATLIEAGVVDGAVLLLEDMAFWAKKAIRFNPPSLRPSSSTGGIGVTWIREEF